MSGRLVYLVAGEPSGDLLGARLMAALKAREPALRFAGVGGPRMAAEGLESLFPFTDLALMGLAEVLPALRRVLARLRATEADIRTRRPAAIVTIDVPGFSLRLAGRVRGAGFPVIHYVAPQVWAWHQSRVKGIARSIDHLLLLLPFEADFFGRHGIACSFVGHPVVESGAAAGDATRFRARHGIKPSRRILLLLPGSRSGEVRRLAPVFGRALGLLAGSRPDLVPAVPTVPSVAPLLRTQVTDWPHAPLVLEDSEEKFDAFAAATAALTKSGTSTLELAIAGVPMVLAYRVNPVTAYLGRRLLKVADVGLVNLLAGKRVVPELLQQDCTPERLAGAVAPLLDDPAAAAAQRASFAAIAASLRPPGGQSPAAAAAEAVLRVMEAAPGGVKAPAA